MKLRDRVRQLAVLCSLIAASSLAGCGGGNEPSPVAASSSSSSPATYSGPESAPPPPAASSDSGSGESSSGGESSGGGPMGMTGPGDPSAGMSGPGMGDPAMGMGMGGMGMGLGAPVPGASDPSSSYGMGMGMGMSSPDMGATMGMGAPGMFGGGQPAPVDPAPSEDDDYMTKAKYAFAIGKEAAAEQYFYAQLLAHDDEAPSLLEQVRWSPGERRPATTVRFAVGVDLKAPAGIDDYRPIGRSQMAGNNGGGGDPMASGYAMAPGMGQPGGQGNKAEKTLADLTGRFGEELITAFESAWDNGDFGTAFKDVEVIEPTKAAATNNPYAPGMGMGSMDMAGMPAMAGPGAPGMGYGAPGDAAAKPADAALRTRAVPGKVIVPGLWYAGTGSVAELQEKAQQEGIDFLFLFEVNVKPARGVVHNDTRLRLISTKDGSAIGATSKLNNLKVDRAVAMKSDSDELAEQIGNLFRKVETLKLTDLPKLEPVHAQARIKSLIANKPASVLQTLMEIRLFHSMGLLDEEERNAAYQLALGGAGVAFAGGTVEDRQFVLDPLLPPYK